MTGDAGSSEIWQGSNDGGFVDNGQCWAATGYHGLRWGHGGTNPVDQDIFQRTGGGIMTGDAGSSEIWQGSDDGGFGDNGQCWAATDTDFLVMDNLYIPVWKLAFPSCQETDRDAEPVVLENRTLYNNKAISLVSCDFWGVNNEQLQTLLESSTHVHHKIRILYHSYQSVRMSQ